MFTGIIETLGEVVAVERTDSGRRFTLRTDEDFCQRLKAGDSVSINGVCHTIESVSSRKFGVTSVGETLARSTMGELVAGDHVNLEAAATPVTALGGHLVQGHVDGVGVISDFVHSDEDRLLTIELPAEIAEFVVTKGSLAVDGVSLTVAHVPDPGHVVITVIPYTLAHTTVGQYGNGRRVNIEVDIIAKYVSHYVSLLGNRGVHSS